MLIIFNQDLYFIVSIAVLYPAYKLFELYSKTKILDFLLFSIFFICGTLAGFTNVLEGVTGSLIFNQLFEFFFDFWYIALLIHALRINKPRISKVILGLALGYFVFLVVLISLWQNFHQPATATVLFITLHHNYSSFYPLGAGLKLKNNIIIYSSGFRLLGDLLRIAISTYLVVIYTKIKPIVKTKQIIKAKQLWILAWIIFLIWNIIIMLPLSPNFPVGLLFVIITTLFLYIAWKYPESMVLSHAQSIRAIKLYDLVNTYKKIDDVHNVGLESFSDYIKLVYEELQTEQNKI